MKRFLPTLLACFTFGCAGEGWMLGDAKHGAKGKFQGNGKNVTIYQTQSSFYFHADEIDNGAATLAQGDAASHVIGAVSGLAGTIGATIATKGLLHP